MSQSERSLWYRTRQVISAVRTVPSMLREHAAEKIANNQRLLYGIITTEDRTQFKTTQVMLAGLAASGVSPFSVIHAELQEQKRLNALPEEELDRRIKAQAEDYLRRHHKLP